MMKNQQILLKTKKLSIVRQLGVVEASKNQRKQTGEVWNTFVNMGLSAHGLPLDLSPVKRMEKVVEQGRD
jgi:hypothetical protein